MSRISRDDYRHLTKRQRLRLVQRQRETRIFSALTVVMCTLLLFGILIGYGLLPIPFFNSFNEKVEYAKSGDTPCPPEEISQTPLDQIEVSVLNSTERNGLAKTAADQLTELGITVSEIGNYPGEVTPTALISADPSNLQNAYTLAQIIPGSKVVLSSSTSVELTVILGTDFESIPKPDRVKELRKNPLKPPVDCLPLNPNLAKVEIPDSNQKKPDEDNSKGEDKPEDEAPQEESTPSDG